MLLENKLARTLSCVEIVDIEGVLVGAGEEMAAVRELDLPARLDRDLVIALEIPCENVHHADSVHKTHNQLVPRGVKGHGHGLVHEDLADLESLCGIVPEPDRVVVSACDHILSLEGDVKAVDVVGVEREYVVIVVCLFTLAIEVHVNPHDLLVLGRENDAVLGRVYCYVVHSRFHDAVVELGVEGP